MKGEWSGPVRMEQGPNEAQVVFELEEIIRKQNPDFYVVPDREFNRYVEAVPSSCLFMDRTVSKIYGPANCVMFRGKTLVRKSAYDELQGQELSGSVQRSDVETLGEEVRIIVPSSVDSIRIGFGRE